MQGSNNAAKVRCSFQETAPRKTARHTVKTRDGGVGLVVANHRGGGESSGVVTTLTCNGMAKVLSLLMKVLCHTDTVTDSQLRQL